MTKEFIEKRITEQERYLHLLVNKYFNGEITYCRFIQIKKSAQGVLRYFVYKMARYEFDEHTQPLNQK